MRTIPAWSASALKAFEACPYSQKLRRIDRIPEPPRPEPPNGTEHANDRGSRIHDNAEAYVRGTEKLCPELSRFQEEFEKLEEYYDQGKVIMEDMWCFDRAWRPVHSRDFRNIWVRIKLDAFVFLEPDVGLVIDYKTGKRYGNEVWHAQQCQLYQLAAFMRYPELKQVHTELWYVDLDDLSHMAFTRSQGERFFKGFNERGMIMTSAMDFPPKPNQENCRFCAYGPVGSSNKWVNKNGACEFGV